MARHYGFKDKLDKSKEHSREAVPDILASLFPGCVSVVESTTAEDRRGVDYWVMMPDRRIGVDIKSRDEDWRERGEDDLALETFSKVDEGRVGWTRDTNKATDYVLWVWRDTGRYCLIPFPALCGVFGTMWETWRRVYKTYRQRTPSRDGGWYSECVFVPRRVVIDALSGWLTPGDCKGGDDEQPT